MQTVRHINPIGYVDMPYLRDEHGNPRQGPAVVEYDGNGDPVYSEAGTGCLVPGEVLEVDDEVADVLLAQTINWELVSVGGLTKAELVSYAETREIDVSDAATKAELVAAVEDEQTARWEARQQPAADEPETSGVSLDDGQHPDPDAAPVVDEPVPDPDDAAGAVETEHQEG